MASKIEIIKRAASRTGNGALVSIDDNAEIARLTEEHYEAIVEDALTVHGLNFARRAEPMQQTSLVVEKPWVQAWRKPAGILSLAYVCDENGQRVEHEERDTDQGACCVVLTSQTALFAVGVWRVSESRWPADFAMGIQHHMEAVFYGGIAEQHDLAEKRELMAERKLQKSRVRDKRASTSTDASEWDLLTARSRRAVWDNRGYR